MELIDSPMSERQFGYRRVYRERIATWYNGFLHVALIYLIGFASRANIGANRNNTSAVPPGDCGISSAPFDAHGLTQGNFFACRCK